MVKYPSQGLQSSHIHDMIHTVITQQCGCVFLHLILEGVFANGCVQDPKYDGL